MRKALRQKNMWNHEIRSCLKTNAKNNLLQFIHQQGEGNQYFLSSFSCQALTCLVLLWPQQAWSRVFIPSQGRMAKLKGTSQTQYHGHLGPDGSSLWWGTEGCLVHHKMLTSTPASTHWMAEASTHSSRHCPMEAKIAPGWEPLSYNEEARNFHSMDSGYTPDSVRTAWGTPEGLCLRSLLWTLVLWPYWYSILRQTSVHTQTCTTGTCTWQSDLPHTPCGHPTSATSPSQEVAPPFTCSWGSTACGHFWPHLPLTPHYLAAGSSQEWNVPLTPYSPSASLQRRYKANSLLGL